MLSAKTERGVCGKPYRAVQKSNEGQNPAVDILTFERYRTNQKVKAKSIEDSLVMAWGLRSREDERGHFVALKSSRRFFWRGSLAAIARHFRSWPCAQQLLFSESARS
jgi:hypothetical protein